MSDKFAHLIIKYRLPLLIAIILISLPMLWLARTSRLSHKAGHILPWGHDNVNLHIAMSKVFGRSNLVAVTLRTEKTTSSTSTPLEKYTAFKKQSS